MTGINYRKHSQRLKEFHRLHEPEGKRRKMYPRGGCLLLASKCLPLGTPHWGVPRGGQQEGHAEKKLTKLTVERSFHLTPVPSQEQRSPRAFSAISAKHPQKNDPLKAPPPKPAITLAGFGHTAQSKHRGSFSL